VTSQMHSNTLNSNRHPTYSTYFQYEKWQLHSWRNNSLFHLNVFLDHQHCMCCGIGTEMWLSTANRSLKHVLYACRYYSHVYDGKMLILARICKQVKQEVQTKIFSELYLI
jgi:hypothetical protein